MADLKPVVPIITLNVILQQKYIKKIIPDGERTTRAASFAGLSTEEGVTCSKPT